MKEITIKTTQRVEFAHVLRGVAALSVLIGHFAGVFWAAPSEVGRLLNSAALDIAMPSYFVPLHFSKFFNYGGFGVALFFLISGFVIPFSLSGLSRRGFLIARIFRIYPVYVISICISILVIWIVGSVINSNHFPYDFKHMVAQALLLRGWLWVPSIDGLSWTLEIELVFYIIAAAMSSLIVGSKRAGRNLIVYALLVPVLCIILLENINYMPGHYQTVVLYLTYALPFTIFMFCGTLFYLLMKKIIGTATLVLGVITLFYCFSVGLATHPSLKVLDTSSYLIALIMFSAFFFARDSFHSNFILDNLANISYPMYAVHAISGYAVMYVMLSRDIAPWIATSIGFLIALILAIFLHKTVEKPTMKFGKKLAKSIFPKERTTDE